MAQSPNPSKEPEKTQKTPIGGALFYALVIISVLSILGLSTLAQVQGSRIHTLQTTVRSANAQNANLVAQLETLKKSLQGLPDTSSNQVEFTPRPDHRVDSVKAQWRFSGVTRGTEAEFLWIVDFLNRDEFNHQVNVTLEFLDGNGFRVAKSTGSGTLFKKDPGEKQRISQIRGNVLIPIRLATSLTSVEVSWVTE